MKCIEGSIRNGVDSVWGDRSMWLVRVIKELGGGLDGLRRSRLKMIFGVRLGGVMPGYVSVCVPWQIIS